MEKENKILFWFRENLSLEHNGGFYHAIQNSTEIIPVYCFDPRENQYSDSSNTIRNFLRDRVQNVEILRRELQLHSSNLLVVTEPYEKIIPSLARVLKVSCVITNNLVLPELSNVPDLIFFRNQKAREVFQLLNMHTIPLVLTDHGNQPDTIPASFPRFPEINPGLIPSL